MRLSPDHCGSLFRDELAEADAEEGEERWGCHRGQPCADPTTCLRRPGGQCLQLLAVGVAAGRTKLELIPEAARAQVFDLSKRPEIRAAAANGGGARREAPRRAPPLREERREALPMPDTADLTAEQLREKARELLAEAATKEKAEKAVQTQREKVLPGLKERRATLAGEVARIDAAIAKIEAGEPADLSALGGSRAKGQTITSPKGRKLNLTPEQRARRIETLAKARAARGKKPAELAG